MSRGDQLFPWYGIANHNGPRELNLHVLSGMRHPTDPTPFDLHRARRRQPTFADTFRRLCRKPFNALQKFRTPSDKAAPGAKHAAATELHCKEGIYMALHHTAAGEVMKLRSISDRDVITRALVKTDSFEAIHLVVRAGEHIPEHKVSGPISLYCIEGETVIDTSEGERRLTSGDWLYLGPDAPHAVRGITDASLVLTVFF